MIPLALLAARMIGDYITQPAWMAENKAGLFAPLRDALITHGDPYMHLADLKSYLDADEALTRLYIRADDWSRIAILNLAGSGKFSSDCTIAQYAAEIWNAKPCPVQE
jgi:starch phosphorylase